MKECNTVSDVWSVRGVSPELRKHIVEAANRSGVTVAQWLDQMVSPEKPESLPPVDDLIDAIDRCLITLERLDDCRPNSRLNLS